MRILYVAHRVPFPPNKGDKIRSFHEIKYLSRNHAIHLLAFYDDPKDANHGKELKGYCHSVTLIRLSRRLQAMKALASMLFGEPWTLGFYRSDEMAAAIRKVFESENPEVAFAYSSSVAPYIEALPVRRVLDFVDSDASKWSQYAKATAFPGSWLCNYESTRLSDFELRMMNAMDASVFVSPREVAWVAENRSRTAATLSSRVYFVPNGIDLDYFQPRPNQAEGSTIVFTGAMDYFPNVEAVQFFARLVLPEVRKKVPAARFVIVGSNPSVPVRQLAYLPGVSVTGTVPDVRPYLAQSRLSVVPLRISQGIQNKVLEALAVGLPVVATPQVAAGLQMLDQLPVSVEFEPQAIAESVVRHLLAPPPDDRDIARTRSVLAQHYSWVTSISKLDALLTS
jgi:polysaccharide biosynthesis protein PslH